MAQPAIMKRLRKCAPRHGAPAGIAAAADGAFLRQNCPLIFRYRRYGRHNH